MENQFNMVTAIPPAQCAARLTAAIDHESVDLSRLHLDLRRGSKPVLGELVGETFILSKRIMGVNSFQTVATGTLYPREGGTLIAGRFSAHPGFRLGYRVWGCFAIFIGVPILVNLSRALLSGAAHLTDLWTPPYHAETYGLLILAGWPLMFFIGRSSAEGEDVFLREFLARTLEARSS